MKRKFSIRILLLVLSVSLVWSCSITFYRHAGGGISGTGVTSVGLITATGSITVNGIKYETSGARVFYGGKDLGLNENLLRTGMIVEVQGTADIKRSSGNAETVRYTRSILGTVSEIDRAGNTMKVLGHTIIISKYTIFGYSGENDFLSFNDIQKTDTVEISGYVDGKGNIHATGIQIVPEMKGLELTCLIASADVAPGTFMAGKLMVNYSSAQLENFEGRNPVCNDLVHIKGEAFDLVSGALIATKVTKISRTFQEGRYIEIEGFIQNVGSDHFSLMTPTGSITIQILNSTKFEKCSLKDIKVGSMFEVEGKIAKSKLAAKRIIYEPHRDQGHNSVH